MPYLKVNYDPKKPCLEEIELSEDVNEFLDMCHREIGCKSIEVAPTFVQDIVLVLDEQGKCFDGWEQRVNPFATLLYGNPYDCIVGDVILARRVDCELLPLNSVDICFFKNYFKRGDPQYDPCT